MRVVEKNERDKRGCLYCTDYKNVGKGKGMMCKFDKCPYRELDDYETYEDYFKAKSTALTGLLEEAADEIN